MRITRRRLTYVTHPSFRRQSWKNSGIKSTSVIRLCRKTWKNRHNRLNLCRSGIQSVNRAMILSRKIPLRHKIMWVVRPLPDLSQRVAKFKKKWEHEVVNVFDNLDTVFKSLAAGTRPMQIKQLGFAHSEPSGIIAIDQKGKRAKGQNSRLSGYIFTLRSRLTFCTS